jgi:hypothetical protein
MIRALGDKKTSALSTLPPGLLAHLRRCKRHGQAFAVEWNPATAVKDAFADVVDDAGLGRGVTPATAAQAATWPRLPRAPENVNRNLLARASDRPCRQDRRQMGAEFGRSVNVGV